MGGLLILLVTVVLDYVLHALLLAAALALWRQRKPGMKNGVGLPVAVFMLFASLDLYRFAAGVALDINVRIGESYVS